jgi:hypothetical protein
MWDQLEQGSVPFAGNPKVTVVFSELDLPEKARTAA